MSTPALVSLLVAARRAAGMFQWQVADAMGTCQSAISEFETGATADPKWSTLLRYAEAVGARLDVQVIPACGTSATPASAGEPKATNQGVDHG